MAYTIDPSIIECSDLNITIEIQGALTRGPVVAGFSWVRSEPNTNVAPEVDSDRLVQLWIERVMGGLTIGNVESYDQP
ncbi:MAG: hypothetical protein OTJ98_00675 [Dehalococcoidia bacterium]|nr:hypothetical protein [Dehalococcoidia bacterium]